MGKTALITGGTRGIGLGIAKALAREKFNLVINGIRPEKDVLEVLAEIRKEGVEVIYCQGNIASSDQRQNLVARGLEKFGQIHVLVNNAGIAPRERKDVLDQDEEGYDEVMAINLKGTFFLTQAVSKEMINAKEKNKDFEGCLINISSISSTVASVNRSAYCMAKAGMGMVTKLFAVRLSEWQIPVYEIRPGIIETDMTAGVKKKYDDLIAQGITLEPRWGQPEDIGKIVVSLALGNIPYATGQVITADGGLTLPRL